MTNNEARFDPSTVRTFRFIGYELHAATLTARLHYAFDDTHSFVEEIVFEGGQMPASATERAALENALSLLHLIAGVSYYKAALPSEIVVETRPPTPLVADFLDELYLMGLGEMAYRNNLDLRDRIDFPSAIPAPDELDLKPPRLDLPRRTAVPVGGGKDSVVTIEALKQANEPMVLFSVGDYEPIREVCRVADLPRVTVHRRLDPALFELNEQGALNGHVPISAVIAAILAVSSILYGFDAAALSNERSADEANLIWKGLEINHQYSKSSFFERDFMRVIEETVMRGFCYFSFLRPFSELAITALFSHTPPAYRQVFRSCNRAFHLDDSRRQEAWCRDCPKCRFVFLALAPFVAKDEMIRIFGGNMFDDMSQEEGYADMLGVGSHKPFECVGEIDECTAALILLSRTISWRNDPIIRMFSEELLIGLVDQDALVAQALHPAGTMNLPRHFHSMLPDMPLIRGYRHLG